MRPPILYLVLSDPVAGYEACARAAVKRKVPFLQLRMKDRPREEILAVGRRLRALTAGTPTRLIINDDPDLAREIDADGVHLGQSDLPLAEARRRWPVPGKLFGLSTHNIEQARAAMEQAPDYIGVGPVFPTSTKPDADPPLGPAETGRIAAAVDRPAFAIGGIGPENISALLPFGLAGICVCGAVCRSHDPEGVIVRLREILRSTPPPS